MLGTLMIEDNNPNMIPMIVLILGVLYLAFCLISLKGKRSKERECQPEPDAAETASGPIEKAEIMHMRKENTAVTGDK